MQQPSVGRAVHYMARGSADGVFPPVCRAATITEVDPDNPTVVGLSVTNPTGLFFHPLSDGGCRQDEPGGHDPGADDPVRGGTWHWPERVR
jgi:hypothetical protein